MGGVLAHHADAVNGLASVFVPQDLCPQLSVGAQWECCVHKQDAQEVLCVL